MMKATRTEKRTCTPKGLVVAASACESRQAAAESPVHALFRTASGNSDRKCRQNILDGFGGQRDGWGEIPASAQKMPPRHHNHDGVGGMHQYHDASGGEFDRKMHLSARLSAYELWRGRPRYAGRHDSYSTDCIANDEEGWRRAVEEAGSGKLAELRSECPAAAYEVIPNVGYAFAKSIRKQVDRWGAFRFFCSSTSA